MDCSLRLRDGCRGRGWTLGIARYSGDDLAWYRVFSLCPRPRRVLSRRGLAVGGRREASREERMALLPGSVVLRLQGDPAAVELAMSEAALTGFLAWMESAPPGSDWDRRVAQQLSGPTAPASAALAAGHPHDVAAGVRDPAQDEQQVRETVEVLRGERVRHVRLGLEQQPRWSARPGA